MHGPFALQKLFQVHAKQTAFLNKQSRKMLFVTTLVT